MSGQGSGQALQAPQKPDLLFDNGRALFARLKANQAQEFAKFRKLKEYEMIAEINNLAYWIENNGPRNKNETFRSKDFLQRLKDIK